MYLRLVELLRCPQCRSRVELKASVATSSGGDEIETGLLRCEQGHWFPVVRGIPRMLPDALQQHWGVVEREIRDTVTDSVVDELKQSMTPYASYDQ